MWKNVFCVLVTPDKFLDIVNNQNVDCLVEVDEVVGCVVAYGIGVLHLE